MTLYLVKIEEDVEYTYPNGWGILSYKPEDVLNREEFKGTVILYIYKVVISVCPIITREPLDGFASNFDWGTRETHGNVLSLFLGF